MCNSSCQRHIAARDIHTECSSRFYVQRGALKFPVHSFDDPVLQLDGYPKIPDTDPNASPRGMAVRFNLPSGPEGKRRHTDIIAHSTPFFTVRTGEDFLGFLQALKVVGDSVREFLGNHPAAGRFVQAPKPLPTIFTREQY